jgi:CRISPR-associated RAMP protein (TIGR02581 family)
MIPELDICSLGGGKDCFHRKFMEKTASGKTRYDLLKEQIKERVEDEYQDSTKTKAELQEEKLFDEVIKDICETCQLFGNGFTASKIFFSDLELMDWAGVTQIRDGVVIDRDSEKAVEGLKYDFEVVPAGAVFTFEIRLENPREPKDVGLTCLGLNEFQSGLGHLGGNRSRGLGNCALEVTETYSTNFKEPEQLKNYLLKTELQEKMEEIKDIPGFLTKSIEELLKNLME